ncbi:MAG: squalene/phytoene synthase family protein, partial [Pseudomonadota bacterium]
MTNEASVGAAERPSGKSAETENFPVGSFLLPAPLRPHVMAFYGFARAIDDVADAGDLEPDEKIRRLQGFGAALEGQNDDPAYDKAIRLRASLLETDVPTRHGLDLISAFEQDAVKGRYGSWDELMDYCDRSASPVGRYLLDLHGEDPAGYPASDALCNALQVINHLQANLPRDDWETLTDPRSPRGVRHRWSAIVSALMLGLITNQRTLADVVDFIEALPRRRRFGLSKVLSESTLWRAPQQLRVAELRAVLHRQAHKMQRNKQLAVLDNIGISLVAIDGKKLSSDAIAHHPQSQDLNKRPGG